ncbi:MAG: hypothetical protein LIO80_10205 [Lachnospiraceae bacterium]|nr:hypothetical protein [Lachnospiraceae bacterium]
MKKEGHVYCNCCGKELQTETGSQMEDYFHMQKTWGYFSRKDGVTQTADICEDCLDRWILRFQIAPEDAEKTELFEC